MKIITVLKTARRVFLDTAPIIYFVEKHPHYFQIVRPVFELIDAGKLKPVTSPITLAECLVHPYQMGHPDVVKAFSNLLIKQMRFVQVDEIIASQAAELRARYNLGLPDAFQFAVALNAGCDAFLTNDSALKRVTELKVIVLNELVEM